MADDRASAQLDEQDEFEIEVIDDRPGEDVNRPPAADLDDDDDDVELTDDDIRDLGQRTQKRIKKLTWRFHEERRAKEEAQRLSRESISYTDLLNKQNQKLRDELQRAAKMAVQYRAATANNDLQMAKARLAVAYEEGDASKIAEAQQMLTVAQINSSGIQRYTEENEEALEARQPVQQQSQPPAVPRPEPRAVEWQKENPWFGVDSEMTALAYGLHENLVRNGVDTSSDQYYEAINKGMRKRFPERFDGGTTDRDREHTQKPSRPIVAQATRNSGVQPRKRIELTATQVALAKRLGLTPEQYARQIIADQQEGRS